MPHLTFVSQNPHKLADVQQLLPNFTVTNINFSVPEIQSLDVQEVTQAKLEFAYQKVGEPCFVLDTSLSFDCLNGFPGPFIKFWYEHTVGAEKSCEIAKLFNEFGCEFRTVLGYFDGQQPHFFEEKVRGRLPTEPRGSNGFHWDVIFIPDGEERTFAEMTFEEKQRYAPQAKLLKRLEEFLQS